MGNIPTGLARHHRSTGLPLGYQLACGSLTMKDWLIALLAAASLLWLALWTGYIFISYWR